MDDRNRNPSQQHQSPPALRGWCAVAQPMVRSVSISLARRRHGLGSWDSEDLEQELWLELFVRHSGRDRADNDRCFGGRDVRHCRDEVCSQLRRGRADRADSDAVIPILAGEGTSPVRAIAPRAAASADGQRVRWMGQRQRARFAAPPGSIARSEVDPS